MCNVQCSVRSLFDITQKIRVQKGLCIKSQNRKSNWAGCLFISFIWYILTNFYLLSSTKNININECMYFFWFSYSNEFLRLESSSFWIFIQESPLKHKKCIWYVIQSCSMSTWDYFSFNSAHNALSQWYHKANAIIASALLFFDIFFFLFFFDAYNTLNVY